MAPIEVDCSFIKNSVVHFLILSILISGASTAYILCAIVIDYINNDSLKIHESFQPPSYIVCLQIHLVHRKAPSLKRLQYELTAQ